jgi:hypothetical protein
MFNLRWDLNGRQDHWVRLCCRLKHRHRRWHILRGVRYSPVPVMLTTLAAVKLVTDLKSRSNSYNSGTGRTCLCSSLQWVLKHLLVQQIYLIILSRQTLVVMTQNRVLTLHVRYCNGFDQRVARQQLWKHVPTCSNGSCVSVENVIARCYATARGQWTD